MNKLIWYVNFGRDLLKRYGFLITARIFLYHFSSVFSPSVLVNQRLSPYKEKIVNVNGYKISLMPGDIGLSRELLAFKSHEPLSTKLLSRELKEGMFCLDIGANIGYYALLENKIVGKNGQVIAIEPSPLNFKRLQQNCNIQKSSRLEAHNYAVGETDGIVNFVVNDHSNWCRVSEDQTTENLSEQAIGKGIRVVKIPIIRIDSFLKKRQIEKLDLVRMDVEGYEVHVYQGMKETIKKFKPILYIELHSGFLGLDGMKKFLKMVKDDGYDIKYYIPRWMDTPLVGNESDIKKIRIDELIERLEELSFGETIQILLK